MEKIKKYPILTSIMVAVIISFMIGTVVGFGSYLSNIKSMD